MKACLEKGDEQRDGETHRPGRTDQDGAKKANPLTVFGQKPGDERAQCRHDCVKDQHFLIQRHFVHLIKNNRAQYASYVDTDQVLMLRVIHYNFMDNNNRVISATSSGCLFPTFTRTKKLLSESDNHES